MRPIHEMWYELVRVHDLANNAKACIYGPYLTIGEYEKSSVPLLLEKMSGFLLTLGKMTININHIHD